MWLQLLCAIAFAAMAGALLQTFLPLSTHQFIEAAMTFLHEAAHGLVGAWGEGRMSSVLVHSDGSGHAMISVTGTVHNVVASAAGLVIPAWIAAILLVVGLTRLCMAGVLIILGAVMGTLAYLYLEADPQPELAIYAIASALIIIGALPMPGTLKSALVLLCAAALIHGVVLSVPYAFTEWIDADQTRPSDARSIADLLELDGITEVSQAFMALIGFGYAVAVLFAWGWLARHWR